MLGVGQRNTHQRVLVTRTNAYSVRIHRDSDLARDAFVSRNYEWQRCSFDLLRTFPAAWRAAA